MRPRTRSFRKPRESDRLGAFLLAVAAAGSLLYISLAGRAGYADPPLVLALAVGLTTAIGFACHERRVAEPLIDLSIIRHRTISVGLISGLVSYVVLFGTLFIVSYYLSAEHLSAVAVGLRLTILPVAIGARLRSPDDRWTGSVRALSPRGA